MLRIPCCALRSRQDGRSRGLTLIELLVVIAVIALLVAILLPSLSKARRSSQGTKCMTVLKQIGLGMEFFAESNRSNYPIAGSHVEWGKVDSITNKPSWMQQVDNYLDVRRGYSNDDAQGERKEPFYSGCPNYPEDSPYHYFISANAAFLERGRFAAVRRDKVKFASQFVLVGDLNRRFGVLDADKDDYTQNCLGLPGVDAAVTGNPWELSGAYWQPHHADGLNSLFTDGHVAHHTEFRIGQMTFAYADQKPWQQP